MSIVISDIEGTLTTGSSWKGLRSYYKTHYDAWGYNRFYLSWVPRYLGVKLGLLSRKEVMSRWMQEEIQLFRGVTRKEFFRIAEWIFEHEMWPKRRKTVLSALEAYRREGAQIVVVSSAYQPIVDVFAHQLKAEPIGSPLIFADDRLIGVSLPINAYEHK
ncbi:MAG: haloacid dehalogenase-like hydrolase, partial [Anaerolineales bacterium]|nr:haloacid dehalogenase-like hydrolase [Anaerolineales bacterium]